MNRKKRSRSTRTSSSSSDEEEEYREENETIPVRQRKVKTKRTSFTATTTTMPISSLYECLFCSFKTTQLSQVMHHLHQVHGRKFDEKTLVFPSYAKFQRWIDRLSTEDGAKFIQTPSSCSGMTTTTTSSQDKQYDYSCTLSHKHNPRVWKYDCISSLRIVHMADDKVIAKYQPYHSAHKRHKVKPGVANNTTATSSSKKKSHSTKRTTSAVA